jgi:predicted RNA binding protein YcfA (HicA-like mRNA interferase family)
MGVKVRDILRMLKDDGWVEARQRGSHKQFKHSLKKGLVTVACHSLSDELAPGTLSSILKQAQMDLRR